MSRFESKRSSILVYFCAIWELVCVQMGSCPTHAQILASAIFHCPSNLAGMKPRSRAYSYSLYCSQILLTSSIYSACKYTAINMYLIVNWLLWQKLGKRLGMRLKVDKLEQVHAIEVVLEVSMNYVGDCCGILIRNKLNLFHIVCTCLLSPVNIRNMLPLSITSSFFYHSMQMIYLYIICQLWIIFRMA